MFSKLSLSVLTLVSAILLASTTSFADCVNVIAAWEVANGYSTGSNIGNALNRNNSGTTQVLSGIGAIAGVVALQNDQKELKLISDAQRNFDSPSVEAFEELVNQILQKRFDKPAVSQAQIFEAVSEASANNQICSRWYGSMTLKQAASIIAGKFAQAN